MPFREFSSKAKSSEQAVDHLPLAPRDRKIALSRAVLEMRLNGQIDRALEFFTPDARVEIVGDDAFSPFAGICIGRKAIGAKLQMLNVTFEYTDIVPYLFVVEGDHVIARWRGRFRNRGTGPSAAIEGIAHLTFVGDQISYYSIFVDTAVVARLANP
jgi:ketosteroid isomerase-like protein